MFDVLMNIIFGSTSTADLTPDQIQCITNGSVCLSILAFVFVTIFFYKLMLFIFRF